MPESPVAGPRAGCSQGDRECEPHDHLLRGNGEIVVTKKRVSAFAGSDLAQIFAATTSTISS